MLDLVAELIYCHLITDYSMMPINPVIQPDTQRYTRSTRR